MWGIYKGREKRFFADCAAGRARHIAARLAQVLLLAARQEVTKKRAKTFPLGTPLASRRFYDKRRGCCFRKNFSIGGAYIPPRRWVCCWQGFLLFRRGAFWERSPFARQMDAERLGFPKTSRASFWVSQRQRGEYAPVCALFNTPALRQ